MSLRLEQKQQTRNALLDAARHLIETGRGLSSISLREVARAAGIVPTGFYRHFADMDELGLALVNEVGDTFREAIRLVRHNELILGGLTDASVDIFLQAVDTHRSHFVFLAREQYGGSQKVRLGLARLRHAISSDLAADLGGMPRWEHLTKEALEIMADLVVKTVFATLPELIDPPDASAFAGQAPREKIRQQLRLIFVGGRHWVGAP